MLKKLSKKCQKNLNYKLLNLFVNQSKSLILDNAGLLPAFSYPYFLPESS